jgi:hypothetical protein
VISFIPKPSFFLEHTRFSSLRSTVPLFASSLTLHTKPRLILSISLINYLSTGKAARWYAAMEVIIELTSLSLADQSMSFPFQALRVLVILSRIGCNSTLEGFFKPKGSPRYLQGSSPIAPPKLVST